MFTVTTTADGNDGECNNDCTLREAIALSYFPAAARRSRCRPGVYGLTQGPLVLTNSPLIFGQGTVGGSRRRRPRDGHRCAQQRSPCW